jgi:transcriptional regulator with XRE-family HTH domain
LQLQSSAGRTFTRPYQRVKRVGSGDREGAMAASQSPIGSRRRLGAELRRLRAKTGLTLDEVAEQMTCSTSKISRLETGKGVPKVPDVRELMRIYGVASDTERDMLLRLVRDGREHGWWESYTEGVQPERFVMDSPGRYPALETEAVTVRAFEVAWVHGLLQSREYTRAVLEALLAGRHDPSEIDRLVELRLRRQEALVDREPPLELAVVLDESVLGRVVGTPAATARALQVVLDRADLPNVTVQVLPLAAGLHRAHAGSFVVLGFPSGVGVDVVYIEGHAGDTYLESRSDVDLYKDVLADVSARALDPAASRALIRRYQQEHEEQRRARP